MRLADKKDAVFPGLRVTQEFADQVRLALETLGLDGSTFRRQLLADLVRIAEAGRSCYLHDY